MSDKAVLGAGPAGQLLDEVPLALDATSVSVSFRGSHRKRSTVVDRVGLGFERAQVTVLLGESGSGKTVFARSITGMAPFGAKVTGSAMFDNHDLLRTSGRQLRAIQGNRIGMVPQDPNSSLDPMRRIGGQLIETLEQHHKVANRQAAHARMIELLELVHIHEPERVARCYPHEVSGGMRQRIAIAIAICCDPELVVADEPSSALDASVGVRVVQLLDDLRVRLSTAILFITHDIGIAALIANQANDRVAVMLSGRIVELGFASQVLGDARHPYTRALIAAEPSASVARGQLAIVPESVRSQRAWSELIPVEPGHGVAQPLDAAGEVRA